MSGIALNFFPVVGDQFTIQLYRLHYAGQERPADEQGRVTRRYLRSNGDGEYCWCTFEQRADATEIECKPFDNIYVTLDALRNALIESCQDNLDPGLFKVSGRIRRYVEIVTHAYDEGEQVATIEPYLLRSRRQFGFLVGFRFHPKRTHVGTRASLQRSLALDNQGRPNYNYYADRHSQLVEYVDRFHSRIFPLHMLDGQEVHVASTLVQLASEELDVKKYVVGSGSETRSQFMGVRESGPFMAGPTDPFLYFLYRGQDRPLSRDLFRALRGDSFRTFPGMAEMFNLPISNQNVSGAVIADFTSSGIREVRDRVVKDAGGRQVVPIVLTPFSRHDTPDDNAAYWILKHAFLSEGIPIQVVASETVADRNKLKWSIASIGLQVFAKLGGRPWKVKPRSKRCLIVGIGQAHRLSEGRIDRHFAYSVLTDSSGVFEEVRVLGDAGDESEYVGEFASSLRKIFSDYSSRFSSFVIHSTFTIRRCELDRIAEVLAERQQASEEGECVSIKFNDRNRFFGFSTNQNSLVPHESTMIQLSNKEFLIWFEGLQYGKPNVHKMIGSPLHVQFTYPDRIDGHQQRSHLQDAINLSGANWRGFNAKSLPVSVYYAQLIAKYLKEFEARMLPAVDVNVLTPWFL